MNAMKLPWTRTTAADQLTRPTDHRWQVRWCAVCRTPQAPLIYFQNGKHYCQPCAAKVYSVISIRSAGRRASDLQFP